MSCGNCPSGYTNNGAKGCKVATLPYGKYRITSNGHARGQQPKGWGLSAWNAHGAERNDVSSRVSVHSGNTWFMDWKIIPGKVAGTWR